MAKVKLQAREIVRTAKRLNIEMGHTFSDCAVAVVGHSIGYNWTQYVKAARQNGDPISGEAFMESIADKLGIPPVNLMALEAGYERGRAGRTEYQMMPFKNNRYFKVGECLRDMLFGPN